MEVIDVDELNSDHHLPQSSLKNETVRLTPSDTYSYFLEIKSPDPKRNGEVYPLKKNKVTIGRALENDIHIASVNVSRNHAVITKEMQGWFIKDTKSTNGVYLMGKKITPELTFALKTGCYFTLGPIEGENQFTFKDLFTLKRRNQDQYKATTSLCVSPPCKIPKNESCFEDLELKKKLEALEQQLKDKEENERLLQEKLLEKDKEKEENERRLQEKLMEKDKEKEESDRRNQEALKEKEKEHELKLTREREIILKHTAEVEKNYEERFQESNRENDQRMRQIVANQTKTILDEKAKVEQKMVQEMNERNKDFQEKLRAEQLRLEKKLAASETKAAMLENKLSETKHLKEQERGEILNKFSELIEAEMNCSICSELFVVAITLGCSHTFCQLCIATWKQKKKDCPICREKIKTEARALVIDNFIDKMVESLPSEMKTHREKIVKEREQKAKENQALGSAQENVAANNIANYLGMMNARANEPTVVINRIATAVPVNARARGFVDLTHQTNAALPQARNVQPNYPNQTVPTTRAAPTYIFSNAPNSNSHSIQIDANTIVRVVGNYRMPINTPETRVQLERILPQAMGRVGTALPQAQNTNAVPIVHLPQYPPPNRGRTSVLNLAQQPRNIMPAPARPNEPIVISDDDSNTPIRGRPPQATNNRARWSGRGQTHQQRN